MIKTRNEIDDKFKWRITDLFESDIAFEEEYTKTQKLIPSILEFKDNITIENLEKCLSLRDKISNLVQKLYVYANLKFHEDSTNNFYQNLSNKVNSLITLYQSNVSFVEPAILKLDEKQLRNAIENHQNFKIYKHFINDLLRSKEHILSPEKEEILAQMYEIASAPDNIFSILNNADIKFKDVTDSKGTTLPLSHSKLSSYLESSDRVLRKNAFKTYYKSFDYLKNTISTIYGSSIKADVFGAKVRNYKSSLDLALSSINVPSSVYENLLNSIEKYLPYLHKYISLRKKILGVSELHFYDLYTPIVKDIDTTKSYEDAKSLVLKSVEPLGENYVSNLKDGLENGWVDVYENIGKRSGAYAWGSYGTHPFVSLNYDNKINSMFTLAHEMGHAMHSFYSWSTQPYIYSDYTIFVAEVASTVNEALLMEHLLETTTDKKERLYLLNYFMEQFRGTVFRQTMFAEFELIVHKNFEDGIPLSFEDMCEIYKKLNIKYYGNDIVIDDEIAMEWLRIPHFYNAFYVYQYATGYSSAIALSRKILKENGTKNYLDFLKSGSSNYSTELLKLAGVDISNSESIDSALNVFCKILEEFENLI